MSRRLFTRLRNHAATFAKFGLKNWIAIVRGNRTGLIKLTSRHARYPLLARPGTSDLSVFRQVFLQREYACLDDVQAPRFIVDCGANVGYSSASLLTRSPQARVISVEPDAGNYEILVKNMAPYGNRVRTIRGAVWSHSTHLTMASTGYRGGEEWATIMFTFRVILCEWTR
jgi:hypothetical protein